MAQGSTLEGPGQAYLVFKVAVCDAPSSSLLHCHSWAVTLFAGSHIQHCASSNCCWYPLTGKRPSQQVSIEIIVTQSPWRQMVSLQISKTKGLRKKMVTVPFSSPTRSPETETQIGWWRWWTCCWAWFAAPFGWTIQEPGDSHFTAPIQGRRKS